MDQKVGFKVILEFGSVRRRGWRRLGIPLMLQKTSMTNVTKRVGVVGMTS